MRSPNGTFDDYHTSEDNMSFVKAGAMAESRRVIERILTTAEQDRTLLNIEPDEELHLGRRGLYRAIGGQHDRGDSAELVQLTLLWALKLAYSDRSLLDSAEQSGKRFEAVVAAANALQRVGLLTEASSQPSRAVLN